VVLLIGTKMNREDAFWNEHDLLSIAARRHLQ